jgi:hypothetical protein
MGLGEIDDIRPTASAFAGAAQNMTTCHWHFRMTQTAESLTCCFSRFYSNGVRFFEPSWNETADKSFKQITNTTSSNHAARRIFKYVCINRDIHVVSIGQFRSTIPTHGTVCSPLMDKTHSICYRNLCHNSLFETDSQGPVGCCYASQERSKGSSVA